MQMKIPLVIMCLVLNACTVSRYYQGEIDAHACSGYSHDRQCAERSKPPDKTTISDDGTILLSYYSGRRIFSGISILRLPLNKERHVLVVKDNKVVDEYYVIQVIEGFFWACGNISGHGNFCDAGYQMICKEYNSSNNTSCDFRKMR